eukprot:TRINITY_DN13460_c1_g1_i1.p1 TRINITY_DN13460_c1_g1~~TRINITY_DN13460_c1_g1_i1.p1  ORF type:complete len:231 (+),score=47.81 TRINITY_DN13460_c1_g1_i1:389-1081(+)
MAIMEQNGVPPSGIAVEGRSACGGYCDGLQELKVKIQAVDDFVKNEYAEAMQCKEDGNIMQEVCEVAQQLQIMFAGMERKMPDAQEMQMQIAYIESKLQVVTESMNGQMTHCKGSVPSSGIAVEGRKPSCMGRGRCSIYRGSEKAYRTQHGIMQSVDDCELKGADLEDLEELTGEPDNKDPNTNLDIAESTAPTDMQLSSTGDGSEMQKPVPGGDASWQALLMRLDAVCK